MDLPGAPEIISIIHAGPGLNAQLLYFQIIKLFAMGLFGQEC